MARSATATLTLVGTEVAREQANRTREEYSTALTVAPQFSHFTVPRAAKKYYEARGERAPTMGLPPRRERLMRQAVSALGHFTTWCDKMERCEALNFDCPPAETLRLSGEQNVGLASAIFYQQSLSEKRTVASVGIVIAQAHSSLSSPYVDYIELLPWRDEARELTNEAFRQFRAGYLDPTTRQVLLLKFEQLFEPRLEFRPFSLARASAFDVVR